MTNSRIDIDNSNERIITQLDSIIDIDRTKKTWISKIMLDELWQSVLSSKHTKDRTLVYIFCLCNITAIGLLWFIEDRDSIAYATTLLISPILVLVFIQCAIRLFTQMKYCKPMDTSSSNTHYTRNSE